MKQFLTFAMVAPMASFGDIAVGERRDSADHPARSAILGLVGACLGIERSDKEAHNALEADYGVAVLSCGIGKSLVDYHTAQASPSAQHKKNGIPRRRAEELDSAELATILSRREYRTDVWHFGALWLRPESGAARWGLDVIENSMKEPYFAPYLGRRSCPLTLPLAPQVNEASSVDRALLERHDGEEWKKKSLSELYKRMIPRGAPSRLYVSKQDAGEVSCEFKLLHNVMRRDALISRRRWQFGLREEAVFIHLEEPTETPSRESGIDQNKFIVVVSTTNPKRPGSRAHTVFALYGEKPVEISTYIKRVIDAGYTRKLAVDSVRWDLSHGLIKFHEEK